MKKQLYLAWIMILVLVLGGCSSGGDYSSEMDNNFTAESMPAPMDPSDRGLGSNVTSNDQESAPGADVEKSATAGLEEKLIYKADLSIETMEFDKSTTALQAMLKEMGAFLEHSSISGGSGRDSAGNLISEGSRNAYYVIRVPKDRFNSFMERSGELGLVLEKNTSVENITTQFYDTDSRLKSFQVQQDRLLEIMGKAERLEDILAVENQLTEVRYQIDQLTTMLRGYQTSVDYSTVSLSICEVMKYTAPEKEGFFARLVRSVGDSFENYGYWAQDFVIGVIYLLPFLLTLAVIGLLLWRPIRKWMNRPLTPASKDAKVSKPWMNTKGTQAPSGTKATNVPWESKELKASKEAGETKETEGGKEPKEPKEPK